MDINFESTYFTYLIVSSSQIGLPKADAARRCESMANQDTCQIEVPTQPLEPTVCATALILNSIMGVKKYCQFKLIIQSVLRPTRTDYLLHVYYLLANVPSMSVICNNYSYVKVIKGCSSCLCNFPCDCTIHTSNLT